MKVGDIIKEIDGTQVLSAPFAVILDTLRQLRCTTRTVVFKDISANCTCEGMWSVVTLPLSHRLARLRCVLARRRVGRGR